MLTGNNELDHVLEDIEFRVESILCEATRAERGKPQTARGFVVTCEADDPPHLPIQFRAMINLDLLRVDVGGTANDIQQGIADALRDLAERVLGVSNVK